jgi:2-C-methyl-D-erythritol 2,4-cyclodiphosphate synthase
MRIGLGFDAHRFADGGRLVLGGVEIPFDRGLQGHSDADVLAHAVTDAVLGAAGLGDIGTHFPASDETWRDASSLVFLERAVAMTRDAGYSVTSVDGVVVCEAPAIAPHRDEIRKWLAGALGCDASVVSVKGTTTDHMGFTGRGEGIAAMAVVLLS